MADPHRSPSHRPAGVLMAAALLAVAAGAALALCTGTTGCTPAARAAAAPFVEGLVGAACPFEAAIPDVGGFLASSCPQQEADVAKALAGSPSPDVEVVTEPTDAGTPRAAVYRRTPKGRVCIGHGVPRPDAGSPVTVVPLPTAPAVLPVVDAGRDGGS